MSYTISSTPPKIVPFTKIVAETQFHRVRQRFFFKKGNDCISVLGVLRQNQLMQQFQKQVRQGKNEKFTKNQQNAYA